MGLPILASQVRPVSETANYAIGGSTISFRLPKESIILGVNLIIEGTIGTAAATAAVENLPALVQQLSLRGALAGAGQWTYCNGVSGPDLYELAQAKCGSLTPYDGSLASAAAFRLVIPIYLQQFFFGDQLSNLRTAMPAYKMSDATLSFQTATLAQVDTNGTPLFAFTGSPLVSVEIMQVYPETVPTLKNELPFVESTLTVTEDASIVTQTPFTQALTAGGLQSLIGIRSFSGANTRQANTGAAPFNNGATGRVVLKDLNNRNREDTSYNNLRARNARMFTDSPVVGNAWFLFNRGINELFDTGALNRTNTNVNFEYNRTAATGARIRFIQERIFNSEQANVLGYDYKGVERLAASA